MTYGETNKKMLEDSYKMSNHSGSINCLVAIIVGLVLLALFSYAGYELLKNIAHEKI